MHAERHKATAAPNLQAIERTASFMNGGDGVRSTVKPLDTDWGAVGRAGNSAMTKAVAAVALMPGEGLEASRFRSGGF
jgi:hypothetical protein